MNEPKNNTNHEPTRQERRQKKAKDQKAKMEQHGKGLARIYKNAVEKRSGKGG